MTANHYEEALGQLQQAEDTLDTLPYDDQLTAIPADIAVAYMLRLLVVTQTAQAHLMAAQVRLSLSLVAPPEETSDGH